MTQKPAPKPRRTDLQKRNQFNEDVGAEALGRIESEGRSSKNTGTVQAGEKLRLAYNALYIDHVMERAKGGWSINMIAIELNVHPSTLRQWALNYPAFGEAYEFAKKARLAKFEHHYLGISSGEVKGSASIAAAYCGKHDPEEYGDPSKVTVNLAGDGLQAIIAAMSASPFSLATSGATIDAEFEHVD